MSYTVDFIKQLREAKFTEEQAEAVVRIIEQTTHAQNQIAEQQSKELSLYKVELTKISSKELATKGDLEKLRYDTLKFVIWTGIGVVVTIASMLAKGFHWL